MKNYNIDSSTGAAIHLKPGHTGIPQIKVGKTVYSIRAETNGDITIFPPIFDSKGTYRGNNVNELRQSLGMSLEISRTADGGYRLTPVSPEDRAE